MSGMSVSRTGAAGDGPLTSIRRGIGIVQFEGYAFYKVTQVIRPANLVRIWGGRCAPHSYSPSVSVVGRWESISLFLGQSNGCIAIYYGPVDAQAL